MVVLSCPLIEAEFSVFDRIYLAIICNQGKFQISSVYQKYKTPPLF
jgi:hypothetical protein